MKKITSLLMAVAMIVCMLPLGAITAFAADTEKAYFCLDITAGPFNDEGKAESSEGAYINTGITPTSNTRVVMKSQVERTKYGATLFGVAYNVDNMNYAFHVNTSDRHYGSGFGLRMSWSNAEIQDRPQTIQLDNHLLTIDSEEVTYPDDPNYAINIKYDTHIFNHTNNGGLPLFLFANNFFGNGIMTYNGQHIRFYSCQIYEGNELKRNFVPAEHKDGALGVFDKVEGKFYEMLYTENYNGTVKCLERNTVAEAEFCAAAGHKQYYEFDGKFYKDEDCTEEITNLDSWLTTEGNNGGMLPALGHNRIEAEQNKDGKSSLKTAATCGADAIYYKVCDRCGAIHTDETWTKSGTALVHDWKSKSAAQHVCLNCQSVEEHTFENGECIVCGRKENNGEYYFARSWNEQLQKVITYEEAIPDNAATITKNNTNLSGGWYIVASDVEFDTKITVSGTSEKPTNIILMDGATLTADNGIIVEGNNVLRIFAQSDNENTMGRLVAVTDGVSAISGTADCGKVYIYGGKILLDSTNAPCIGAGNGSNGREGISGYSERHGGDGGNGGSINGIYFYGGESVLKSSVACIKSGNGGCGGKGADDNVNDGFDVGGSGGGNGGNGGDAGELTACFYGGNTCLESTGAACIACGSGGAAGVGGRHYGYGSRQHARGNWGKFKSPSITISGDAVIKAGENEQGADSVDKYDNQKYLSVQYGGGDDISVVGSVLSEGSWWILVGAAAAVLVGVAALVIVKKKKKPVAANGAGTEDEE